MNHELVIWSMVRSARSQRRGARLYAKKGMPWDAFDCQSRAADAMLWARLLRGDSVASLRVTAKARAKLMAVPA